MGITKSLKKFRLISELRRIWLAAFRYKKLKNYLQARFLLNARLRRSNTKFGLGVPNPDYSVHFLSCAKDLDILTWSLISWYLNVPDSGQIYIHEDGSFTEGDCGRLKKYFPNIKIASYGQSRQNFETWLVGYPKALGFRKEDRKYIFAIKLLDPIFTSSAPKRLVLDSDMLWFKKPDEVLENLKAGRSFMIKGKGPMDYSFADGGTLAGAIANANSGIVGYSAKAFDLGRLEEFLKKNGANNPSRVIEQAAYAYVLGDKDFVFLPPETYHIKGAWGNGTIAKHFTGPRREEFWIEGVPAVYDKMKRESIL